MSDVGNVTEKKGWWEKAYGLVGDAANAVKLALQKPQERKKLKMKFEAAYTNAEEKKVNAKLDLSNLRDPQKFDINKMFELRETIEQLEKQQDLLKDEYEMAFDKEMKVSDSDED